jgi:hypothetical protein
MNPESTEAPAGKLLHNLNAEQLAAVTLPPNRR